MITATAVQTAKLGKEAELEALMKDLVAKVKANEQGCTIFEFVRSADKPRTYLVFEQYADEEAFKFHRGTDYLKEFIPKMMECLERDPEMENYEDVA